MRRDAERLADIIEAADKITARVAKGRETFDKDEDVQIERRTGGTWSQVPAGS